MFRDLEIADEICQLCDHPDIRYQFEIGNLNTDATLLIGSECINRFGIAATDEEGRTLDAAETKRKVGQDRRKLVEDARKRRVIKSLVALAHADTEMENIESFIDYLQDRGAFTPKQMAFLVWRFHQMDIDYRKTDFKIILRRNREKEQLLDMPEWKREQLKPCLSSSQKSWLKKALQDRED